MASAKGQQERSEGGEQVIAIAFTVLAFALTTAMIRIWLQDDAIAHLERQCGAAAATAHEAIHQRDETLQMLDEHNRRVGAYLREATLLSLENERLKRGEEWIDADDVIAQAEEWLEVQS